MGRVVHIFFLAFALAGFAGKTQTNSTLNLTEKKFFEGTYTNFYLDNLDNVYLLNADNQVKKLNADGDSVAVSNALKKFGDVYSMDVSNPLKIILYYKDFATIAVLDRFLKNINTIDLRLHEVIQASAVAVSYDNNYWVFDEVENRLKKIDDNGKLLLSTPDLRTVFSESFTPEKIIDDNGYVYLYNKQNGIKIFDYYGAFKQSVDGFNQNDIQISKNFIYGFSDAKMHAYKMNVFSEAAYSFNKVFINPLKFQKSSNSLYVLQNDGLHIYAIQQYFDRLF